MSEPSVRGQRQRRYRNEGTIWAEPSPSTGQAGRPEWRGRATVGGISYRLKGRAFREDGEVGVRLRFQPDEEEVG